MCSLRRPVPEIVFRFREIITELDKVTRFQVADIIIMLSLLIDRFSKLHTAGLAQSHLSYIAHVTHTQGQVLYVVRLFLF